MINVVGLGAAGCAMADALASYPQYSVYKLDVGLPRKGNTYPIKEQATHEAYDQSEIKLTQFMSRMEKNKNLLFIMAGGGAISGASLQVLKQLHQKYPKTIDLLYIKPDVDLLSDVARKRDRICYRILQEYTRSGLFRSMMVISNPHVEEALGDLPVKTYYENMNNYVAYAYHMLNVFTHTPSELSSSPVSRAEHVRIGTFGMLDLKESEEKMFFPLDKVVNKCYYYGITEQRLETDGKLLKQIKNQVKSGSSEQATCSYTVHSTSYEEDMAFVMCWSNQVQVYPEDHYQSI